MCVSANTPLVGRRTKSSCTPLVSAYYIFMRVGHTDYGSCKSHAAAGLLIACNDLGIASVRIHFKLVSIKQ